ncbi:DUF4291 family protein [uncultured Microscilla sp.]|uniref:DUF4291 family protein n=1 Tax=uncultured Microscilla sp. TaxID=432653 RepID=UPI002636438A|nr:DUF4291 family protein [uncultured Microscilla sp.]
MQKQIYAAYDDEGLFVYQAFKPKVVATAAAKGTFGTGFNTNRLTWIKPSFAWVLQRTKYATKHRMNSIARIKLSHEGWLHLLQQAVPTQYDAQRYTNEEDWQQALDKAVVIHQWDPERDLLGKKLDRAAIQVGVRSEELSLRYVNEWILDIEDVTELAHTIGSLQKQRNPRLPETPKERLYPVSEEMALALGCF